MMDFVHGGGHYMHRIYVPYADNLVFGIAEDKVFAFTGYDIKKNKPDILKEFEISEQLVEKALLLARAQNDLQQQSQDIKKILASVKQR